MGTNIAITLPLICVALASALYLLASIIGRIQGSVDASALLAASERMDRAEDRAFRMASMASAPSASTLRSAQVYMATSVAGRNARLLASSRYGYVRRPSDRTLRSAGQAWLADDATDVCGDRVIRIGGVDVLATPSERPNHRCAHSGQSVYGYREKAYESLAA